MWEQWYPIYSAICYFGSLGLLSLVHGRWVGRRFRQFRKLDWAYELLVTWLIAVAWWHGVRQGPVWDTELPGSPLGVRGVLALAAVVVAVAAGWRLEQRSRAGGGLDRLARAWLVPVGAGEASGERGLPRLRRDLCELRRREAADRRPGCWVGPPDDPGDEAAEGTSGPARCLPGW